MLNEYWAAVVPAIDAGGGVIEHFAGDGVMAIFNAGGDQPDHAERAARTGLAIVAAGRAVATAHPGLAGLPRRGQHRARRSSASSARTLGGASPRSATRSIPRRA